MKYIILCTFLLFITAVKSYAQEQDKKVKDFFRGKTQIDSPLNLRDPFKAPFVKKKNQKPIAKGILRDGVFTNLPTLENVEVNKIIIKGIFVGESRRAIATLEEVQNVTFVIKEGMKIGREQAEVKAILPGGIVIVEKIVNVYGQEEYLETIIPIST